MSKENNSKGQKMWGGRFATLPSDALQAINASIGVDQKMWREDIDGSLAHSNMLAKTGVISNSDRDAIHTGLKKIAAKIENNDFEFSVELEDIHPVSYTHLDVYKRQMQCVIMKMIAH